MKHFVIHSDKGYSSFPYICRNDSSLYIVFRSAPVKVDKEHIHYKSRVIIKRSINGGASWRIMGDPISAQIGNAGIQDPCLAVLRDGAFILSYFHWKKTKHMEGVWIRHSSNQGRIWNKSIQVTRHGKPLAARQAVVECRDGSLLLAGYDADGCWLSRSFDGGHTWLEVIPIAENTDRIEFSEPCLICFNGGHILCVLRTLDKNTGRSTWIYQAHGWNFGQQWQMPIATPMRGLPPSLIALSDGRVLCSYGYRRIPFGIRACLSHDEGQTWDIGREVVLRSDGADFDIGYPSSTQLDNEHILTVYYIHTKDNPIRRIEGTIWTLPKGG